MHGKAKLYVDMLIFPCQTLQPIVNHHCHAPSPYTILLSWSLLLFTQKLSDMALCYTMPCAFILF